MLFVLIAKEYRSKAVFFKLARGKMAVSDVKPDNRKKFLYGSKRSRTDNSFRNHQRTSQ